MKVKTLLKINCRTTFTLAIALSLLCSTIIAAIPASVSASAATDTLQQDVNALQATGNTGVLAQLVDHGDSTKARAGVAKQGESDPVPFNGRFRTGSDTKTMVSAVVLQLVGEHKLSLDDSVEQWLPGVIQGNGNDGSKITVRQLLNHTSGLFDFTQDNTFLTTILTSEGFKANRFHHYEPQDLINIALAHQPNFAPGTSWSYSNTNYIVVGQIIKAVTGKTWDKELSQRIIKPLSLNSTYVPGDDPTINGPHAHGYNIYTSDPQNRTYTDTTLDNMTWAGAAGAVITTTKDENRFLSALLSGKILAPTQLAEMETTVELAPGVGYGLGILHESFNCPAGGTGEFWGHDGGTVGYATYVLATPDGNRSVVVSQSTTTFSDLQYANDSSAALSTLLIHVFCPGTNANSATAAPQKAMTSAPEITLPGLKMTSGIL